MSAFYKIGLISDTHGELPPKVAAIFKGVDAIVHAGDIGSRSVVQKLEEVAPVTAVRGNCDIGLLASFFEDMEQFEILGHKIAVMHRLSQAQPLLDKNVDGIIIFGHTHYPEKFNRQGAFFINPGSPIRPRGFDFGTVAILTLSEKATTLAFYETT